MFPFLRRYLVRNITDSWVGEPRYRLSIDLSDFSLNGVRTGDGIDGLSGLGRSDWVKQRDSYIRYASRGISLGVYQGRLSTVFVAVSRIDELRKFTGSWKFRDRIIEITPETKKCEVIDLLGNPRDSWDDGTDDCLGYQIDSVEAEFLWCSGRGILRYVSWDLRAQRLEQVAAGNVR